MRVVPPPTASVISSACVSPFELEKRPKLAPPGKEDLRPEASPITTTTPFDDEPDDFLPSMKESEYTAFVETLLA